jgi:hypothetical protein
VKSGSFVFQSIARSEPQACNWFPIQSFPQRIFLHSLLGEKKKPDPLPLSDRKHPRKMGSGKWENGKMGSVCKS